jgi:hypothetical protein
MLAAHLPVSHETKVQRKQKTGVEIAIKCLVSHKLFNRFMGGVDQYDHIRQGHMLDCFRLFDFCVYLSCLFFFI